MLWTPKPLAQAYSTGIEGTRSLRRRAEPTQVRQRLQWITARNRV